MMASANRKMAGYVRDRMEAAERGEAEALYDLGLLYSTGQGVDIDLITAHKWFNLAAMSGVRRAVVDRTELAQEMNSVEVAEAQRLAREWLKSQDPVAVETSMVAAAAFAG